MSMQHAVAAMPCHSYLPTSLSHPSSFAWALLCQGKSNSDMPANGETSQTARVPNSAPLMRDGDPSFTQRGSCSRPYVVRRRWEWRQGRTLSCGAQRFSSGRIFFT
jgi:hypothetical protein